MSAELSEECPELVLSALEDLTIEVKLLEQMMLHIAAIAESVVDTMDESSGHPKH